MDTVIAIVIIIAAACFVFNKVRNQINAKEGAGCGCSGGCSPKGTSCCGGGIDEHISNGK